MHKKKQKIVFFNKLFITLQSHKMDKKRNNEN